MPLLETGGWIIDHHGLIVLPIWTPGVIGKGGVRAFCTCSGALLSFRLHAAPARAPLTLLQNSGAPGCALTDGEGHLGNGPHGRGAPLLHVSAGAQIDPEARPDQRRSAQEAATPAGPEGRLVRGGRTGLCRVGRHGWAALSPARKMAAPSTTPWCGISGTTTEVGALFFSSMERGWLCATVNRLQESTPPLFVPVWERNPLLTFVR